MNRHEWFELVRDALAFLLFALAVVGVFWVLPL